MSPPCQSTVVQTGVDAAEAAGILGPQVRRRGMTTGLMEQQTWLSMTAVEC